jgi:hypothetical protein
VQRLSQYDSLSSSKNSANSLESSLGKSIEKHGESMLKVARMAAAEQQKNCKHAHAEQECNRVDNCINFLCGRINDLRDNKRAMVLWLADPAMQNQTIIDAVLHEVKGIENEIKFNVEEMNSLIAMPMKSNLSPNFFWWDYNIMPNYLFFPKLYLFFPKLIRCRSYSAIVS